ncbi:predicted protein [Nematostella vectensis]|uniref:G-protein coupled receptors family 1 profile domain-containing protein n=1 Tax=Nematostella vectensis TaxID=45351 RepID=A7RXC3_NEMVE|nr:predicted protein [Nematostella vectensis]|eukprot:XP_001636067.1 predicted protein [Nematostella vectensis]
MAMEGRLNWTFELSNGTTARGLSASEKAQVGGFVAVIVLGIALNLTVILLVVFKKVPKKNTIVFIVNMAVADMSSLLLEPTYSINSIISPSSRWFGLDFVSSALCKAYIVLLNSVTWVSLITLLIISLERLKEVSSVVQLNTLSRRSLALLIAMSWALSFGLHTIFLAKCDAEQIDGSFDCVCLQEMDISIIFLVSNGLYFTLVIAIVVINLVIIRRLVHSQAAIDLPAAQQERRVKKFRSAVRMVLGSLLAYTTCVTPLYIFLSIYHVEFLFKKTLDYNPSEVAVYLFLLLFHVNCVLGPIMYFVFLDDFRHALRSLLWNKKRRSERTRSCNTTSQTIMGEMNEMDEMNQRHAENINEAMENREGINTCSRGTVTVHKNEVKENDEGKSGLARQLRNTNDATESSEVKTCKKAPVGYTNEAIDTNETEQSILDTAL